MEQRKAQGSPTKHFFVEMLTRDIDLEDAILDLLDNCLDGALRQGSKGADETKPYAGYWARITCTSESFLILDNCGGIPLEIAEKYAFRMGRDNSDDDTRDKTVETVGMYGIGMKRAIFKMGTDAIVTSRTVDEQFSVNIEQDWINDDTNWDFPIKMEDSSGGEYGTELLISPLHEGVSSVFGDENFESRLRDRIASYYDRIIQKGFAVYVGSGDSAVAPGTTRLLVVDGGIEPYTFRHELENVSVFFAVGLNAAPMSVEDDDEPATTRRSYDDGGWTVYCNDRAVLVKDKTRVVGWGDGIPSYHWQFAVISGMVEFRAKDATHLPIGTTKRNVDTSSDLWLQVRREMVKATKVYTDYTNWWRNERRSKQEPYVKGAKSLSIDALKSRSVSHDISSKKRGDMVGAIVVNPREQLKKLRPDSVAASTRRIVYTRDLEDIRKVAEYLLDDPEARPSDVGAESFDLHLRAAERDK